MAKVQFNCRLEEDVAQYIADEATRKGCSQADLITVWANRSSVGMLSEPAPRKLSKKAQAVEARKASDPLAQNLGREDIDYTNPDELPSGGSVGVVDAVGPKLADGRGKVTMETWRANRKPLLKPGDRK